MINLLLAIDGTESTGYSRRWIEEFHNEFGNTFGKDEGYKKYDGGPHTFSFGERNCREIYIDSMIWLANTITKYYAEKNNENIESYKKIISQHAKAINSLGVHKHWDLREPSDYPMAESKKLSMDTLFSNFKNSDAIKKFVSENIQISIVGHSRGGHVAIALNNMLPFKVHFLGLLDPVDKDMSLAIETDEIKTNWIYIYHAIRSKNFAVESTHFHEKWSYRFSARGYFGYDGLKNRTHSVEEYNTSHGGLGGSQLPNGDTMIKDDITCSEIYPEINQCYSISEAEQQTPINLMNRYQSLNIMKSQPEINFKISGHEFKVNRIRKLNADCFNESNRVRNDFFNAAKKAGLKLSNKK